MDHSSKIRILIVDDSQHSMASYKHGLELRPHVETKWLETVEKALEEFGRFDYDALVLDLMMPPGCLSKGEKDDGLDTGKRLYERFRSEFLRQEPVVVLSNVTDAVDLSDIIATDPLFRALDKGDAGPGSLLATIEELVARYRQRPH